MIRIGWTASELLASNQRSLVEGNRFCKLIQFVKSTYLSITGNGYSGERPV